MIRKHGKINEKRQEEEIFKTQIVPVHGNQKRWRGPLGVAPPSLRRFSRTGVHKGPTDLTTSTTFQI